MNQGVFQNSPGYTGSVNYAVRVRAVPPCIMKQCGMEKGTESQNAKKYRNDKTSRGMPILAIHALTRSFQSTGKQCFRDGTHQHTHN